MANAPEFAELGRWLLLAAAAALVIIVGIYAVNTLAAVGTLVLLLVVGGLFVWIVGGRLWDWLRHGKPLFRGNRGDSDGS